MPGIAFVSSIVKLPSAPVVNAGLLGMLVVVLDLAARGAVPSVTTPVTVNLSGSGSVPPAPPVPVLALEVPVLALALVAIAPPAPLLEAVAAVVGSEAHEATSAVASEALRAIEERARVVTRRG